MVRSVIKWSFVLTCFDLAIADLVGVPTVPFTETGGSFDLGSVKAIVIDPTHQHATDCNGYTQIPPTLSEFAETFANDLKPFVRDQVQTCNDQKYYGEPDSYIYITLGNSSEFVDAADRWTSEAYSLTVTSRNITIIGASPLGAWWGTRTILQQAALKNGNIPTGYGIDAPGWKTRGVMLDCARHYYPPEFITEMCSWLSFWKQNTFHIHLSDNLYNNVDIYSLERQLSLYARFRLWSDDPAVAGLNRHRNESYTRKDFEQMQSSCAARGVTLIPEIEAPGHSLVITQWKPDLGLKTDLSQLNLSNPDTLPTVKAIWNTFLPWFHSTEVSIGADEYQDSTLSKYDTAEEYNTFVSEMNDYIRAAGKTMRIWGTFPPRGNYTRPTPKNVNIQHWAQFEDNAKFDYLNNGYNVINSDDQFYIVTKISNSYPQVLNKTRIFHGNPADASAWSPNIYDARNATNNVERSNPFVIGQIAAQWNDYGANTTTFLEAYGSWRDNLPALADKQWGGQLTEAQYDEVYARLQAAAPNQNLDRRIRSQSPTIFSYNLAGLEGTAIKDQSGNGYDAETGCSSTSDGTALSFRNGCKVTTPLGSKGADYMLSFTLRQTSSTPGVLFSGPDSELRSGNGTSSQLMFVSAGNAFALNYSLPVGQWVNAQVSLRGNRTFFSTDDEDLEFKTLIGYNGLTLNLTTIAVVAPLAQIGGGEWEGEMKAVQLVGTQI